jgi:hypothetical protein
MMFIVSPDDRMQVIQALNARGVAASPVHLTSQGSETWIAPAPHWNRAFDGSTERSMTLVERHRQFDLNQPWPSLHAGP